MRTAATPARSDARRAAAARLVVPAALVGLLSACGAAEPAAPSPLTDASATAAARAQVVGPCPAPTQPSPAGPEVDPPPAGSTPAEAAARREDEAWAQVLDGWLRCRLPDAYGELRLAPGPHPDVTAALTAAAGRDPLAGAPVGVLAGRVRVETIAFSAVELLALGTRVDAATTACGLTPTSRLVGVRAVEVGAGVVGQGGPGVAAVERCLDEADLGTAPGRAQVTVSDAADSPT